MKSSAIIFAVLAALLLTTEAQAKRKKPQEPEEPQRLERTQLHSALMSFSDDFAVAIATEVDAMMSAYEDPAKRQAALRRKLRPAQASMVTAASPNPDVALIDMVVLVSLERLAVEEHWNPTVFGEDGAGLLAALVRMEARIWTLADRVLTPEQRAQLKTAIDNWVDNNDISKAASFMRLGNFAEERLRTTTTSGGRGAFSSVKRTVSEVEEMRLMADRAMFYAQRLSVLLSWQMEYTVGEMLLKPELQTTFDNAGTLVEAVSQLVDIVDRLPEDIDATTESTFERAAELLVDQRQELLDLLESQDPRFRSALEDVNSTIDTANGLTVEANRLVDAVDDLTTSLDVDSSTLDKLPEMAEVRGSLADASALVEQSIELTESLRSLLGSSDLDESIGRLEDLEQAGDRWIGKLFRTAVILILLFFACALATALAYRAFSRRKAA